MKILFITTLAHSPFGGSEILWSNMALYANEKKHRVATLVYKWDQKPDIQKSFEKCGIDLIYRQNPSIFKRIIYKFFKKLIEANIPKKVILFKPDIIIVSQGHTFDLAYSQHTGIFNWLLKQNKPYFIVCQNGTDYNFIPETIIRERIIAIFTNAKKVLFVSERNQRTATNILQNHFSNFKVISNSLNIKKNEIGIVEYPQSEVINFAIVANLKCSHKGQNIVFDILSQPLWKQRNWKLNLYGKGEDEEYLKKLAEFLGIADRVNFNGYISGIKNIWAQNHIMLLASFGEGMPLALQEAMLCGRGAVATDVGGNSELITDGQTGYLADGTTFASFNNAMEKAWQRKSEWKEIGIKAFNFAKARVDLNIEETLINMVTKQ